MLSNLGDPLIPLRNFFPELKVSSINYQSFVTLGLGFERILLGSLYIHLCSQTFQELVCTKWWRKGGGGSERSHGDSKSRPWKVNPMFILYLEAVPNFFEGKLEGRTPCILTASLNYNYPNTGLSTQKCCLGLRWGHNPCGRKSAIFNFPQHSEKG